MVQAMPWLVVVPGRRSQVAVDLGPHSLFSFSFPLFPVPYSPSHSRAPNHPRTNRPTVIAAGGSRLVSTTRS